MMSELGGLISEIVKYGWPPVLIAAIVYIILRGEVNFRYPRK
jgi:hypothetical protein